MAKNSLAGEEDLPTPSLTVKDYDWGCIYSGTRIQIIAAGIVRLKDWPTFGSGVATFEGRWELGGKMRKVTIEKDYCPTDNVAGDVWMHYSDEELAARPKVENAVKELARLHAEIVQIVTAINPPPLSALLGIPAEPVAHDHGEARESS